MAFLTLATSARAWDCHTDGKVQTVTVTLQQMDISVQPVGETFNVTLQIKCVDNNVTIDIPSIKQTFKSSRHSFNFTPPPGYVPDSDAQPPVFPTLYPAPPKGDKKSASSYPCLPPGDKTPVDKDHPCLPPIYPLGGFIDTVENGIPAGFRPTGGLPFTFEVQSKTTLGLRYQGYIDNQGRLQFSALGDYPLDVGDFETSPTSVTYLIKPIPQVTLNNFKISPGPSNAAIWAPNDYAPCADGASKVYDGGEPSDCDSHTGIHFDLGDYDDPQKGFFNGTYYSIWADNSAALNVPQDQGFKSYALAKIKVEDFGKTFKIERVVNLNQESGGEPLDPNFTYAEGSVAIDPTNEKHVVVFYQQRKYSRIGFVLSSSIDGGKTWTKRRLGLAKEHDLYKPVDKEIPLGGADLHVGFDRFGGMWVSYLGVAFPDPPNRVLIEVLLYSSNMGKTFNTVATLSSDETRVRPVVQRLYGDLDYDYLGVGPDATNLNYDSVWMSIADAINSSTPNEADQIMIGLRVKGLGFKNIDIASKKCYRLPSTKVAGWPSIDIDPKGEVIVALRQANVKGTYVEQIQDNNRSWIVVLENGLAGDDEGGAGCRADGKESIAWSKKREFALTAMGDGRAFPPQPHNLYLGPGTSMLAIDKSTQHPGRIYVVYTNRPNINSDASKPYLIWSDDVGFTWSNPINVSTDKSPRTADLATIAVDPTTGVVALAWVDARGSVNDEEVNHYGVFLDPRELN